MKTVTVYYHTQEGEWEETSRTEYEYDGEWPLSRSEVFNQTDQGEPQHYEYTFDDQRQPVSMTVRSEETHSETTTAYQNGRVWEISSTSPVSDAKTYFQYTDKGDYFTLVFHTMHQEASEDSPASSMEEADSICVTENKGLLVKTVNSGMYANWNEGEEIPWERFNGTYTAEYDENGIIAATSAEFRAGPSGDQDSFETVIENGRITEVLRYYAGSTEPVYRYVFEYTGTEVSPARYASMINYHLMEDGGTYYIYSWY